MYLFFLYSKVFETVTLCGVFKPLLLPLDYNFQNRPVSTIKKEDYLQTIHFERLILV